MTAVTQGYRPNLAIQPAWNRQTNWQNLQTDPGPMWRNERLMAQTRGDQWEGEFGQNSGQYGGAEGGYSNQVADLYNPIWQGGGGYTDEQMGNVLGLDERNRALQGLDQNFLTDDEQQGAMGDPFGEFRLSGDYEQGMSNMARDTGQMQMGTIPGLQGAQDAWSGRLGEAYQGAIDPNRLRASEGYGQRVGAGLGTAMEGVNDPGLGVTQDYLDQARISNQEVDQLASAGARTAAAPYQAGLSTLYRNAAASGTVNPLATGAMAMQYARGEGATAADAANRARLDARSAQRNAAQNIQDTQLGAAGQRSGLRMNYGNMAIGAAGDLERARMAGEQDLSTRQMQAGERQAQTGIDNARNLATYARDTYGQVGDRNLGVAQGNANMRLGAFRQGEQNNADRRYSLATNRQGVNQGNVQTRLGANQDLSSRYQSAYSPWLSAQQEGRQAAIGQQGYFGGRKQDTDQLRLGGSQLQQQGTQGAVSGYNQWKSIDKQPGKVAQGFNTAANFVNAGANARNAFGG